MQGEDMPDLGRDVGRGEVAGRAVSGQGGGRGRFPRGCDLGRAIRELRGKRGLTIEELAFAADVHPTYLSSIERGRRNPSWEKLCALAGGLDVEIAALVLRAESAERVRVGLERVLSEELARCPPAGDLTCPNQGR
jgi:transcriptional regulator with XRE-family HTH domain